MSPRAAWRLESLGFEQIYDYVAGKADWGAAGLPLAGTASPRAGQHARSDVPTCRLEERLADLQARVRASGWDTCIVVNEHRIVLGRIGRRALSFGDDLSVEQAMTPGPRTFRPSAMLETITEHMREHNLSSALITRSDGALVGLLRPGRRRAPIPIVKKP